MKKLILLAALMILCLGLFAADPDGAKDIIVPTEIEVPAPYNLEGAIINVNDVFLLWLNPVYTDTPMGFRVYCNGNLVLYVPGDNVQDCVVPCVCDGCHHFYVTAYFDSQTETPPSNTVEINVTDNVDYVQNTGSLALKAYPNPFRSGVNLGLTNNKAADETRLTIYNAKGQSLKSVMLRGNTSWNWDTKDSSGNPVPAGVYFAKAVSGSKSTLVKLMLTQ